ncbi:MAG: helix-turn-helix transcriptional regulator [Caldisericaceae bacterium]|nr:helix-turn-helix transcriptional regulator [Caldisericaceae bacterium]
MEDRGKVLKEILEKINDKIKEGKIDLAKEVFLFRKLHIEKLLESPDFNIFIASMFTTTGFLSFYILYLLQKKDYFGQEIINEISERTENCWLPNPGVIYPLLKEMKDDGLIEGKWATEGVHPRFVYHITDKGKEQYDKLYKVIKIKFTEFRYITDKISKELFGE